MPPGIPENQTPAYKAAKLAVIILSALIILALIALVIGGLSKMRSRPSAAATGAPSVFTLAPGARILAMESQPGRLILRLRTATGEEIDIIDTADGRLISQIKATAEKPQK
jgi:hypothetical protein